MLDTAKLQWDLTWSILTEESGWTLASGKSLNSGQVYYKNFKSLGRVTKLKVSRFSLVVTTNEMGFF